MATEHEQREAVAGQLHDIWATWAEHFIGNITLDNLLRWKKQAQLEYAELTEEEKEKDRELADKIMNTVRRFPVDEEHA